MNGLEYLRRTVIVALLLIVSSVQVFAELPCAPGESTESVRPRVGLVLSGGGALGFAHIGVIRVLEELGVPVDFVAGTSMGSIIGALYASGYSAQEMAEVLKSIDWTALFLGKAERGNLPYHLRRTRGPYVVELPLSPEGVAVEPGLLDSRGIEIIFALLTAHTAGIEDFDLLPIPYRAVAADLVSGQEVVFATGSLVEAMRASMTVPGLFEPVRKDGMALVDGGIVNNMPVEVAIEAGCDIVIAVDLSLRDENEQFIEPFSVLNRSIGIMIEKRTVGQRDLATLVIAPDVSDYSAADFRSSDRLIEIGETAARSMIPDIERALGPVNGRPEHNSAIPNRIGPVPSETIIDEIEVEGFPSRQAQALRQALGFQYGRRLDVWKVYERVGALSMQRYGSTLFSLRTGADGRTILSIIAGDPLPETKLHTFRFGYSLRGTIPHLDEEVLVHAGLVYRDLIGSGSLWTVNLSLIDQRRVETELFIPFGSFLFVSPLLSAQVDERRRFEEQETTAVYEIARTDAELRAGVLLGAWGELYAGYRASLVDTTVDIEAGDGIDPFDGFVSSLLAGWRIDNLDRFVFPSSGASLSVDFEAALPGLGSDDEFRQVSLDGYRFFALTPEHVLGFHIGFGTDFGTGLEEYRLFSIGGADTLPGYRWGTLSGQHYGFFGIEYRYLLTRVEGGIARQGRVHARLRAAVGNAWQSLPERIPDDMDLHGGVSLGAGVETPIGPITMDLGVSDGFDWMVSIGIGDTIR